MRVVVLGSTGFIGGNVMKHLRGSGHTVFPYSRNTADLLDLLAISSAFKRDRPDAIVNCAAHTGSGHYVNTNAAEVFADNAQMALNLYRAVQKACPSARVVNLISNCSYPGDIGMQKETDWLKGPVHDSIFAYGNAKRTLYYTAATFAKQYGIRSINFIIPEAFGPGDHTDPGHTHATDGMVIRLLQAKKAGAKEFLIWGTGKPVREAMFVDDVATLLLRGLTTTQDLLYPQNLGQGKGHSILQTAKAIAKVAGFTGKLVCDTSKQDGAPKKVLNAARFKKLFPDFVFTDFEVGLEKTIAYYEKALSR